ncbi:MAG: hypothetical protein AAF604_16030 [Acidobacteriota bacterium]
MNRISQRLPHRGPALLVKEIVQRDGDRLVCEGEIPPTSAFADGGRAPAFLALELAAQSAALVESSTDEEPRIGYLVRIRRAQLAAPSVPTGVRLRTEIQPLGGSGGLRMFRVRVLLDGEEIASGDLTTVLTD